jgi:hypothetical protein
MKKLFVFMALLSVLVSCELSVGEYRQDTQTALQQYTMDAFSSYVIMPVMMAELAVDFDAYLSLTEEEKAKDFRFYGNIRNPETDMYLIGLDGLTCTLQTGGKSIWDEDAQWTILSFTADTDLNGDGALYCSTSEKTVLDSDPVAPGDSSLRIFSTQLGKNPAGMVLCSLAEGVYEWKVGSNGQISDTDGYMAEYMTGDNGVYVTKRFNQALEGYEYICSGDFLVTVFKNNEPIDMCKAVFKPGFRTQYVSGK